MSEFFDIDARIEALAEQAELECADSFKTIEQTAQKTDRRSLRHL